jgi:hypothetical protein
MTAFAIDDYHPRPEWWLVSQGARKRVATDEKGRPVYDDVEWPRTGINDLDDLKAYVKAALGIIEGLRGYADVNSVIGLEHGKRAVDNVRSWLFNHEFRGYPAEPRSVSELDRASVESLLREVITWIEDKLVHHPDEGGDDAPSPVVRPKRSTEKGEGRALLIAALTKHHKYADGGCLNLEPIGNNELARQAEVANSTASSFFTKEFQGHIKYRAMCQDAERLVGAMKLLNEEFSPFHLYGARPPGEDDREDDE